MIWINYPQSRGAAPASILRNLPMLTAGRKGCQADAIFQ
jgi:hypothetical protein